MDEKTFDSIARAIFKEVFHLLGYLETDRRKGEMIEFTSGFLQVRFSYSSRLLERNIFFIPLTETHLVDSFTFIDYENFLSKEYNEEIDIENISDLSLYLKEVFKLMQKFDFELLRPNSEHLQIVMRFIHRKRAEEFIRWKIEEAKIAAQTEWKKGNYQQVVNILEPYYDKLPDSFKKKLEISMKRVS